MKIFKYIISLAALLSVAQAEAQVYEKRVRDWKPSEFFIAADVVGLGRLASGDVQTEFQAKIDFDFYYLAVDAGRTVLSSSGDGFDYSSKGNFFRVGPQINLIPYNKNRNVICFGLMYAQSDFSDKIDYSLTAEDFWTEKQLAFSNDDLQARWLEATMGLNVRIAGPLYMGYTIRFKLAKDLDGVDTLEPFEIPGYGEASKTSAFGFNYYVIYRFGFRKKPVPAKPRMISPKQPEN
ncbi:MULTISPECIES: DUF6048 family protein [Reichenbachiella]|uniref:DUF6048 family protein n=1 Tax=Reichenbachiella TaxID=156993 RepID=UPI000E6B93F5|nr:MULTISPECIES: DUF6048 family protein [Reichenbachiella]MBU2915324.1 hypothetical protein [Reichenbachiella agariperforans]RJE70546.1 hypothetical protein BGP76_10690 [Reichenbachiella sp. MSK19-1]